MGATSSKPCTTGVSLIYYGEVNDSGTGLVTGGVMLDNSILSVVDCLSYSVKIINVNSNTVISCLKLSSRPWDITRVKKEQIVVACDKKLIFINVVNILSVVKEVNITEDCCSIVYTNNTLIVSCLNPGSVKILDLDGHVLKVISSHENGQKLFEKPCSIALSPDNETLYVADEDNHSVTSMGIDGTPKRVYKLDTLKSPCCLAVDKEGNIFIAGQGQYVMHIITPQYPIRRLLKEDLVGGITKPYAMICDNN